jgi:hypothetical protein
MDGQSALASAAILNRVLAGNADERGFVTGEHRYLAIAQRAGMRPAPVNAARTPDPIPAGALPRPARRSSRPRRRSPTQDQRWCCPYRATRLALSAAR